MRTDNSRSKPIEMEVRMAGNITAATNGNGYVDRFIDSSGNIIYIEPQTYHTAIEESNAATSKAKTAAAFATEKAGAADKAAKAASAAASKAEDAAAGIAESLEKKQDKLTAGDGISISGSTISAASTKAEVIPLASSVLNPESGEHAVFIVKAGHVCTLVVNGRTGKNGTDLGMDASLIDTDSSTVLNGLLPENYRHDGVLNLGTQNGSSIDRAIITLERNPYNNDKPLAVHDINNNYYNTIKTGTLIAYTFTWAI